MRLQNEDMILGQDRYYSLDTRKTGLNNNVLVVGASGTGKTRGIVIPNLLQAKGSYIVSDPKGNLYRKYGEYLQNKGYTVKMLDFKTFAPLTRYNPFAYVHDTQDILQVAYMLIHQKKEGSIREDPFWDDAAVLLLTSLISLMRESEKLVAKIGSRHNGDSILSDICREMPNLHNLMRLADLCSVPEDVSYVSGMDKIMRSVEEVAPESFALSQYKKFRVAASRTLRSILITVNAHLGTFDIPGLRRITRTDTVDLPSIGKEKTALFVNVSDTDRSLDGLVNIFFTQAMHELVRCADSQEDSRLPVPVRFILDDFATNCMIVDFPKMISSIRSREISAMLMIQSEGQLEQSYERDSSTIISNCDTYVYLGGNDLRTAKAIAERTDLPLKNILNMPVGSNWIFRRGEEPIRGKSLDLEAFLKQRWTQEERGVS